MKRRPRLLRFQPLRRTLNVPVWADVGARLFAALALVFIVVLIHWADRDGLKDSYDGVVSFLDVVYFTMISITTTGFGDIAPVSDRARLIAAGIIGALIAVFAFVNLNQVRVHWLVTTGKTPLILVIAVAFLLGMVVDRLAVRARRKRQP